ncbi:MULTISPECIES: hypothetical protein [unclassified Mesorhizobium]|uniref:hypothetical protein n=1 Tax=unclassified Mesorhizobium TaxID=325217 RepID=UPI0025EC592E|nr:MULTISPECIES: hypothetical protein [unclassified Mesorhizobium]
MDDPDIADLLDRLKDVSRLLEHQLWQAASSLALDKASAQGRRFGRLVEAGAMLDATLLLAAHAAPGLSVAWAGKAGGRWRCILRTERGARRSSSEHGDLPAAVLSALLSSRLEHHGKCQGEIHDTRTDKVEARRRDDRAGHALQERQGRSGATGDAGGLADRAGGRRAGRLRNHG